MFPLLERDAPNPLELFQIWLNLPAADKLVEPHFSMLWADAIPRHVATRRRRAPTEVTVVAGRLGDAARRRRRRTRGRARPSTDVAIWTIRMAPGAQLDAAARPPRGTNRTLYFFRGARRCGSTAARCSPGTRASTSRGDAPSCSRTAPAPRSCCCCRAARSASRSCSTGPFVMNTRGRDPAGVRRLPAHAVRRLAVAERGAGARARRGPLRAPRRRPDRRRRRRSRRRLTSRRHHSATAASIPVAAGASPAAPRTQLRPPALAR